MEYTIKYFTSDISVDKYIKRFRNEERFIELCKECPNFGCSWGCPPFDFERIRTEKKLLEMEHKYNRYTFAYSGQCLYCNDSECTRKRNHPCLHPDKVRPSLSAFGFDIGRTFSELFGIELLWGKDGILPEYLMLVSGLFHNSTENIRDYTNSDSFSE